MGPSTVAVVGGSLGGLTAALLLRDLGLDVTVYERSAAELEQRGAGIGFLPACYRYLVERAGVDLDQISIATDRIRYLNRDGAVIHDEAHAYRFSSWNTVYRSLLACFGRDRYLLGREMVALVTDNDRAVITFADGTTREVDLLVCADGVGSCARGSLLPSLRPIYAGYVAWRGLVPERGLSPDTAGALCDAITYYIYANSHILVYPVPGADGSVRPGERLFNFVWYRNYLACGDLEDVLTDADRARHELSLPPGAARLEHVAEVRAVAAARLPARIAEVVLATDRPFLQAVFDMEVPRMVFGRICLIGDAAFAVRPHAAAGTAKAAENAWTLAAALERQTALNAALSDWEPNQLALGRQLLERTRRIGRRSQVDGSWQPGDPELIFGLHGPGQ
jgi:2,6-dihydroxypyridine 3-monooxygenase